MSQFHRCENCGEVFSENDDLSVNLNGLWYCCEECSKEGEDE